MPAFLKSDLFLRFLGGFVVGAVGMFVLQPGEQPVLTSPAMAAAASAASATAADDAAL